MRKKMLHVPILLGLCFLVAGVLIAQDRREDQLRNQIYNLELRQQKIIDDYGPNHPQVTSLRNEIDLLIAHARKTGMTLERYDADQIEDLNLRIILNNLAAQVEALENRVQELENPAAKTLLLDGTP